MAAKKSVSARNNHQRNLPRNVGGTQSRQRAFAQKSARILVPIVLITMAASGIAQLTPARAQSVQISDS